MATTITPAPVSATPSPPPSSPAGATTISHLDLMLALRRFRSSQLHELVDRLRLSDASIDATACTLIDDMLPHRKGYPPFPVERIKRFGTSDLRELALSLCLAEPAARVVALVEIERINAAHPGLFLKKAKAASPTSTSTSTTTTTTTSSSSSSTTGVVGGGAMGGAEGVVEVENKKKMTRTKRKLKDLLLSFLDTMEYANEGNIHRG